MATSGANLPLVEWPGPNNQNQRLPTFLRIPLEVRDKIYDFAFTSPTGYIHFVPTGSTTNSPVSIVPIDPNTGKDDPDNRIRLSLLLTCHQIRFECERGYPLQVGSKLFKCNTVYLSVDSFFWQIPHWNSHYWMTRDILFKINIQDDNRAECYDVERILEGLPECLDFHPPYQQVLESITLQLCGGRDFSPKSMTQLWGKDHFDKTAQAAYVGMFKNVRKNFRKKGLERKMVLAPDLQRVHPWGVPMTEGEQSEVEDRIDKTVWRLHKAFGGELWSGGTLRFKDRVRVKELAPLETFEETPEEHICRKGYYCDCTDSTGAFVGGLGRR